MPAKTDKQRRYFAWQYSLKKEGKPHELKLSDEVMKEFMRRKGKGK